MKRAPNAPGGHRKHGHSRVRGGDARGHLNGGVGRPVVDEEDLDVLVGLREQRLERRYNKRLCEIYEDIP